MTQTIKSLAYLLAALACPSLAMAGEKPTMPHELEEIVSEDFMHLEEAYRDNEWKKAHQITVKMDKEFSKLLPKVLKEAMPDESRKVLSQFDFQLKSFKKALASQDTKKAEHTFTMIEAVLVDVIESFQYEHHPVLAMFDKEIEEFGEEVNFKEISGEIHEMEDFLSRIEASLLTKGVSKEQIKEYHDSLAALKASVDARHKERTLASLEELRKINSGMMALVKSR